jgi:hypothetical protein
MNPYKGETPMLYSGHFSFDELSDTERHGYFTCIATAATPELALQKFRQRIHAIKEERLSPLFKDIKAVYVEDIVEISENPDDPVVTRFQSSEGPFPKSVSCALPASETSDIRAFQWVSDDESPRARQGDAARDYKEAVPVIEFS